MLSNFFATLFLKKNIKLDRFGNEYGGFCAVNIIKNKQASVFSFGIGEDLSFSQDIISKCLKAKVFAFDPTPKSIFYVKKHQLRNNKNFKFFPYGLSDKSGKQDFYLPLNSEYVSGSFKKNKTLNRQPITVEMRTLGYLTQKLEIHHIDILKMDIEGSEFKVIGKLKKYNISIDQICLETHERFYPVIIKDIILLKMYFDLFSMGFVLVYKEKDDYTFIKNKLLQ